MELNNIIYMICNLYRYYFIFKIKDSRKTCKTHKKNIYICDSREQNILKLPDIQIAKLDVGDYTVENSNIFIERKYLRINIIYFNYKCL